MARGPITLKPRSLRALRVDAGLTRWVLYAVAVVGVIATVRHTLAPPRPTSAPSATTEARDPAAEGFAALFARRYLTFDASRVEQRRAALAPFVGDGLDPDAGLRLPVEGTQRVRWAEVVQERAGAPGERVFTVAADTDRSGLLYVSVPVQRGADRELRIGGYPAIVGQPQIAPAEDADARRLREVSDRALGATVRRALRNYLAGSTTNLAADLAASARVALPGVRLTLERVSELIWAPGAGAVLATVRADDAHGAGYTLRYELDVARRAGRWEIGAIQMDSTT